MKNSSFSIQVEPSHYVHDYDSPERFLSYYTQIDAARTTQPKTILEIGVGNKTVCNYLRTLGYTVTTCDFDARLKPNKVGDIRALPFKDNQFDTVLACEILEHIPFSDVLQALKELHRVTRRSVVISIPYSCAFVEQVLAISIPFIHKQFRLALRIPYFPFKIIFGDKNKEHYWEMGRRYYSKRRVRRLLRHYFTIEREFQPLLNSGHYFFVLRK